MKKRTVIGLFLALSLVALTACQTSVTPPTATPSPQPTQQPYSTFMQNTQVYQVEDTTLTPHEAAQQLMTLFMNDLCQPSQERTFWITQYKNLRVEALPTMELKAPAVLGYGLTADEVGDMFWIVQPVEYQFQYSGTLSPIGECPEGEWMTQEDQGSTCGFLMEKTEQGYTLQSRYQ